MIRLWSIIGLGLLVLSCTSGLGSWGRGEAADFSQASIQVDGDFTIRDLRDLVDEAYRSPDRYQKYSRFLEIYDQVPLKYWYQAGGMSHYLRLLCDALTFYGRTEEAASLLLEGYDTAGSGRQYILQRFLGRFEATYPVSRLLRDTPEFNRYLSRAEKETAQASPEDEAALFAARELFYYYLNRVYPLVKEGRAKEALLLIYKADVLAGRFPFFPWERQIPGLFRRALSFYQENLPEQRQPLRFRWLGLFIPEVDARVINSDGTERECRVKMEDQQVAERILYNQDQTATASWIYYYFSRGQIWMDFDFRPVNSAVTGETPADLVPEKLNPFPTQAMQDLYENYDGLIYLYPNELRPGMWTGGNTWPPLVPHEKRSDRRMFTLWMKESGSWRAYIHEIFHNFEQAYHIKPSHGYFEIHRDSWPDDYAAWVSQNEDLSELVYYESQFVLTVVPRGVEPVFDRKPGDSEN